MGGAIDVPWLEFSNITVMQKSVFLCILNVDDNDEDNDNDDDDDDNDDVDDDGNDDNDHD